MCPGNQNSPSIHPSKSKDGNLAGQDTIHKLVDGLISLTRSCARSASEEGVITALRLLEEHSIDVSRAYPVTDRFADLSRAFDSLLISYKYCSEHDVRNNYVENLFWIMSRLVTAHDLNDKGLNILQYLYFDSPNNGCNRGGHEFINELVFADEDDENGLIEAFYSRDNPYGLIAPAMSLVNEDGDDLSSTAALFYSKYLKHKGGADPRDKDGFTLWDRIAEHNSSVAANLLASPAVDRSASSLTRAVNYACRQNHSIVPLLSEATDNGSHFEAINHESVLFDHVLSRGKSGNDGTHDLTVAQYLSWLWEHDSVWMHDWLEAQPGRREAALTAVKNGIDCLAEMPWRQASETLAMMKIKANIEADGVLDSFGRDPDQAPSFI